MASASLSKQSAFVRGIRLHLRLLVACAVGAAALFLLPSAWAHSTRILAAWDTTLLLYLGATLRLFINPDLQRLKARAAEDDEGAAVIILLVALAALASLGAIVLEMGIAKAKPETLWLHTVLAVATIVLSWIFIHVIFAQHYAHQYYGDRGTHAEGVKFPDKAAPDHWDFLYFSLVIGMTSQVSDVVVTKRSVRRTVLAHGVLSFFFNTAIIALTVNIAASVL
jgi:uncharacterized membrane protein